MKKIIIGLALLSLVLIVGCDTCSTSYEVYSVDEKLIDTCEVKDCSWNNCKYWDCNKYDKIDGGSYLIKEVAGTC